MYPNQLRESINPPLRHDSATEWVGSAPTPDVAPVGMTHHTAEATNHDPGAFFVAVGDIEYGPFRSEVLALVSIALAEAEAASRLSEEWPDLGHLRDAVRDTQDEARSGAAHDAESDERWARRGDHQ